MKKKQKNRKVVIRMYKGYVPIAPRPAERAISTSSGQHGMRNKYRRWRAEMRKWLIDWVQEGDFPDFLDELTRMPDGRFYRNLESKRRVLQSDFYGWKLQAVFVLPRPRTSELPFPVKSGDIDNFIKAFVDSIFEPLNSESFNKIFEADLGENYFKNHKLNDAFIQSVSCVKRYTRLGSDEKPHIEFSMEMITL